MKGIILAGGTGSRLFPLTVSVSKQLMPVYDKPMIFYPLATLMLAQIREILIITSPRDLSAFKDLLGDGSELGIKISYEVQSFPKGLADAFIIGEKFIGKESVALILGDNIFYGASFGQNIKSYLPDTGALIFGYQVANPEAYGVIEFDSLGNPVSIEEKPSFAKSNFVVPGLYFYDNSVVRYAKMLKPSPREELEISELNQMYLDQKKLIVKKIDRGTAWLDTGTFDTLLEASEFVRAIEKRQGLKIGSPEEIAWRLGYIDDAQLRTLAQKYRSSGYGDYLLSLLPSGEK